MWITYRELCHRIVIKLGFKATKLTLIALPMGNAQNNLNLNEIYLKIGLIGRVIYF